MRRGYQIFAILALMSLLLAGCAQSASGGPANSAAGGSAAPGGTTVNVTIQEWAVLPDTESVSAGEVTFVVTNNGPEDVHEFVMIRTDLDPGALPTDATGAVDEGGAGIELIDRIADLPVGESQEMTVTLAAGSYVLVCNIYDEAAQQAHYAMGMRASFTVE